MPRVQAVLCYHIAVRHVKLQRIAFWHIDMVHLFQKDGFIKFIKPQNFRADLDHIFVVDGAAHRTAGTFLLFLFAAAVPELHVAPVCPLVVHIALTAVRTFDFSRKAGSVQALVCQRSQLPAPCHLLLHKVKSGLVDNGRMGVLHIVLGKFPSVLFPLLGDKTVLAPAAKLAYEGKGEFKAGDHCQFCKAKANCRKRAEYNLELARYDFEMPALLGDDEVAAILTKADELVSWAGDIKDYALQKALSGTKFTGFKVVEGRSNRKYTDEAAVAKAVEDAGYEPYEKKLLGITAMSQALGRKKFEELLGGLVYKPPGKPVLVPESDKRPAMNTAINDFKENEEDNNYGKDRK